MRNGMPVDSHLRSANEVAGISNGSINIRDCAPLQPQFITWSQRPFSLNRLFSYFKVLNVGGLDYQTFGGVVSEQNKSYRTNRVRSCLLRLDPDKLVGCSGVRLWHQPQAGGSLGAARTFRLLGTDVPGAHARTPIKRRSEQILKGSTSTSTRTILMQGR